MSDNPNRNPTNMQLAQSIDDLIQELEQLKEDIDHCSHYVPDHDPQPDDVFHPHIVGANQPSYPLMASFIGFRLGFVEREHLRGRVIALHAGARYAFIRPKSVCIKELMG